MLRNNGGEGIYVCNCCEMVGKVWYEINYRENNGDVSTGKQ